MKLLKVDEVCALIGAKRSTVYQWAETGLIPCYKINGCVRFEKDEILQWIKERKRSIIS